MPGAVWHEVKGGGHFIAVGEAEKIFAVAAEELGAWQTRCSIRR